MKFLRCAAAVVACLFTLSNVAAAQESKASQALDISSSFPDNTGNQISPATTRAYLNRLVNSYQQAPFIRKVTLTSDTLATSDFGNLVQYNNASAIAVTLPQAIGSFASWNAYVSNAGTGIVTVTPQGGSLINGQSTLTLAQGQTYQIVSDGANYQLASPTIQVGNNVEGIIGAPGFDNTQFFIFNAPTTPSTPLFTTLRADRAASYSGGTPGSVYSSIVGHSTPSSGIANNEWAIVGIVDNFSTQSTSQNVGVYGQGNKKVAASSSTWGGTFQCQELAGTADPTTSCTGLEVDLNANGTDAHAQRQGMQLVITKAVGANPAPTVTNGILLSPSGGLPANGVFVNGILEQGQYTNGISQTGTYTDGLKLGGTYTIGVDLTSATVTTAIALATGQQISFNSAAMTIDGTFSTGATTPTFTAGNKPGSTSGSGPGTWIKVIFSGQTYWVPAWLN